MELTETLGSGCLTEDEGMSHCWSPKTKFRWDFDLDDFSTASLKSSPYSALLLYVYVLDRAVACGMMTVMEGERERRRSARSGGYLSFSQKDVGDDVREAAAQHQHHALLTVCYTGHLEMRGALGTGLHVVVEVYSSARRRADLGSQAAVGAHSAEGQQGLLEGWG
ncbi:hypothetical protein EYF80_003340 [Liparis tanakae]|uniref:Uncharacterized protein n=1 Tax=Liparis tanakae TaxID=230148 RepID=A0A4Z2J8Y9_9TELE|nr:hypothetical protein EYF80_003340 [Liparis tanakae]